MRTCQESCEVPSLHEVPTVNRSRVAEDDIEILKTNTLHGSQRSSLPEDAFGNKDTQFLNTGHVSG